jgi:hypothetical protein
MARGVWAVLSAVPAVAAALLVHQAIQDYWFPSVPWWDQLAAGAALVALAVVGQLRYTWSAFPDLAGIPSALTLMLLIVIGLDLVSTGVRPDIAAGWAATWGRAPWWDRVALFAVPAGGAAAWVLRKAREPLLDILLGAAVGFVAYWSVLGTPPWRDRLMPVLGVLVAASYTLSWWRRRAMKAH